MYLPIDTETLDYGTANREANPKHFVFIRIQYVLQERAGGRKQSCWARAELAGKLTSCREGGRTKAELAGGWINLTTQNLAV